VYSYGAASRVKAALAGLIETGDGSEPQEPDIRLAGSGRREVKSRERQRLTQ